MTRAEEIALDRIPQTADACLYDPAKLRATFAAALESYAREEREPRSMASAPRDGTRILVYFKRHGWLTVAWTEAATGIEIWCCDDFKFGPYAIRGYIESDVLGWLPLPAEFAARIREGQ